LVLLTPSTGRRRLITIGLGVLAIAVSPLSAEETAMALANGLTAVEFKRSGGQFFLTLGGTVDLDDSHPGVRSEATTGVRPLTDSERTMFAELDQAKLRDAPAPLNAPHPDGYQWDVTLSFRNEPPVMLRWYMQATPDPAMEAKAPGVSALAVWVKREVDRIWAHRTGAPPP